MKNKYINKLILSSVIVGAFTLSSSLISSSAYARSSGNLNDTIHIGNSGLPKTLDPQQMNGTWERMVATNVFLGLTTINAKGQTVPGLASKWETKNGGRIFVFHLRKGLKWSDGKPITADDVVFSYRHLMDPKTASKYASFMYLVKNGKEVNTGKKPTTALGVKKINNLTVQFDLINPTPFFAGLQTHQVASIIPKHVVEKYGKQWSRDAHIVSNGPYKVVKSKGFTVINLTKDENFYDAKNVKIKNVVFYSQEDEEALARRFKTGEVDWVDIFDTAKYDLYNKEMPGTAIIAPYQGVEYLSFNLLKKPYDQVKLRQALSMSINRKTLIKTVLKGYSPAYNFVPSGLAGISGANKVYWSKWPMSKRLATAKKFMADLGYSKAHPLQVNVSYNTNTEHRKELVAISSFWKKIGVKVKLSNSDATTLYDNLERKHFEIGRAAWVPDYNDAYDFLFLLYGKIGGSNNYSSYNNPVYNKYMKLGASEVNMKKRANYFYKAEGQLMKDMPIIPIHFYISKNLKSTKLKGYYSNAVDTHPVRYMYFVK